MFNTKPKIRQVSMPVKKPAPASSHDRKPASHANSPAANASSKKPGVSRTVSGPPANRYALTPSAKSSGKSRPERETSLSVRQPPQHKRKALSPSTPQWGDSSSSESEDEELELRKRQKTSSSLEPVVDRRCLEPDLQRRIRFQDPADLDNRDTDRAEEQAGRPQKTKGMGRLIHCSEMSTGNSTKDYKSAFLGTEKFVAELQYPSPFPPEKFETVVPLDSSNLNPLDDIYESIEVIINHYLPSSLAAELSSEISGTVRLLKRAVSKNAPSDFRDALASFNSLMKENIENGTINTVLDAIHSIPLSLSKRILTQTYSRVVSPQSHTLNHEQGATTYGELLPRFAHDIFQQTNLKSSHVFVDLGSGVGNVVLQAALQTGAESWGIEIMEKPARLATGQSRELRARARRWNLSMGQLRLLHGSFLESPEIDAVLPRADVILVNNKVFPQNLNRSLLDKFLDLKTGAKVVSLQSFMMGRGGEWDIASLFEEKTYSSGTHSVSWDWAGQDYYIATKVR